MGELIFYIFLCIFSAWVYFTAGTYEGSKFDKSAGPAFFPQAIAVCLFICCIILMIQWVMKRRKKEEQKPFKLKELFYSTGGLFLYGAIAYAAVMKFIGFVPATALFLVYATNMLYKKTTGSFGTVWRIVIRVVSMIALAVALGFFLNWANIIMPKGTIW